METVPIASDCITDPEIEGHSIDIFLLDVRLEVSVGVANNSLLKVFFTDLGSVFYFFQNFCHYFLPSSFEIIKFPDSFEELSEKSSW